MVTSRRMTIAKLAASVPSTLGQDECRVWDQACDGLPTGCDDASGVPRLATSPLCTLVNNGVSVRHTDTEKQQRKMQRIEDQQRVSERTGKDVDAW